MIKRLYVGNLPFTTTEDEVREAFAMFGDVVEVKLISDRETKRPRGFGFVAMSSGAEDAMESLDGSDFGGRRLTVNEARARESKPREERGRNGHGGARGSSGKDDYDWS